MVTIEYKTSSNWRDNLTETAHEIIDQQKSILYAKAEIKSTLPFTIKFDSEAKPNWTGLQKTITTKAKIHYIDPSKIISSNFHVN